MGRYEEVDLSRLSLIAVKDRPTRVSVDDFATVGSGEEATALIDRLPDQLGARTLRRVIDAVVKAHRGGRPVVLLVGAHVIKVGVNPLLVAWLERGVATHLAVHGAGAVHGLPVLARGGSGRVRRECRFLNDYGDALR